MMHSRFISHLPKLMSRSCKVSAKRISLVPCMTFTSSSRRERTSQLESVINNLPQQDVKLMLQPYHYDMLMPNDSIRSYLLRAFNYWMNLPNDVIETLEQIIIMYYECVLIADDIDDNSDYRRTRPSAHKLFGVSRTEISSRAGLFIIAKKLMEISEEAAQVYVDNVLKYSMGTYKEIHYRDNMICPTMEEYRQMSADKTGAVVCLTLQLMQSLAGNKTDFTRLMDLMGVHLQYLTDISNLCDQKTWDRKGFCQDFTEGKYTVPIIHAINSGTIEGDIVFNIIRQKTKDMATKKYCLSLMEKLGSLDFAKKATVAVENELREEINRLGGNPLLVECIDRVNGWKYDEVYPKGQKDPTFLDDSDSRMSFEASQ